MYLSIAFIAVKLHLISCFCYKLNGTKYDLTDIKPIDVVTKYGTFQSNYEYSSIQVDENGSPTTIQEFIDLLYKHIFYDNPGDKLINNITLPYFNIIPIWNVPYAKTPIGNRRFKYPVKRDPWNGTFSTSCIMTRCRTYVSKDHTARDFYGHDSVVSDDCLVMRIYGTKIALNVSSQVPVIDTQNKKPVLFWIGGEDYGYSPVLNSHYHLIYNAEHADVLVVYPQFRHGPLGFLYLEELQPGNAGLLDLVMALEWVNDNIERFGGDRTKITVAGYATGASYVGMMMLSPLSRNLFQQSVMFSESPISSVAISSKNEVLHNSLKLADLLDCSQDNNTEILTCLQNKDVELIFYSMPFYSSNLRQNFGPIVDGKFLTDLPINILQENKFVKKRIIIGINSLIELEKFAMQNLPFAQNISQNHCITISESELRRTLMSIFPFYSGSTIVDIIYEYSDMSCSSNFDSLLNIIKDYLYTCSIKEYADYYAINDAVFIYNFQFEKGYTKWPAISKDLNGKRDIDKILKYYPGFKRQEEIEIKFIYNNLMMLSRFLKTGNPNEETTKAKQGNENQVKWPAYTKELKEYLKFTISGDLEIDEYNYAVMTNKTFRTEISSDFTIFKACNFFKTLPVKHNFQENMYEGKKNNVCIASLENCQKEEIKRRI